MLSAKMESLEWLKEAKLGLFFHWDLGGVLGEEDRGDHWGQTPFSEYKHLIQGFTAEHLDVDAFAGKLKEWGFRYVVPTSKHGDGLCFWDSATTDFTTKNSPAGRDLLGEWADACRKHGLRLGVYFCGSDWSHPMAEALYKPGDAYRHDRIDLYYEEGDPDADTKVGEFAKMMSDQLHEICRNYGELLCLWWDATPKNSPAYNAGDFRKLVYDLQPGILQNTRIDYHDPKNDDWGDFHTPEQVVPPFPLTYRGEQIPWESCLTTTNNWMYEKSDVAFKSAQAIVRTLVESCSKGGNLLLNVCPDGKGRIPQPILDNLERIGGWLNVNGESIWGTVAGPRWDIPKVALTRNGSVLYVHYYGSDRTLTLPGFGASLLSAKYLANGAQIEMIESGNRVVLDLKDSPMDPFDTVIRLEFDGEPVRTQSLPMFPSDMVVKSGKVSTEPSEADWDAAEWRTLTCENGVTIFDKKTPADDLSARFAVLNNDKTLYVRAEVHQTSLGEADIVTITNYDGFAESQGAKANEELTHRSSFELFFDALPPSPEVTTDGRCFQIIVTASGDWTIGFADKEKVDCTVRVETKDCGYSIYAAIPLSSLIKDLGRTDYEYDLTNYFGLPPKDAPISDNTATVVAGDEIGFNVGVNAVFPTGGLRAFRQRIWWHTRSLNSFNDPCQWGRIKLAR